MTTEKTIEFGKIFLKTIENEKGSATYEFVETAIKALEQEAVLDKIKAEIWDLQYGDEEKSMTDEDRADGYNNAIIQAIEIIDKYRK